ncbi:hypothetical protein COOONC_06508, partial [Cooperia oncophora]
ICTQSNASTEGVDVQYRSYTVVIGVDSINYGLEGVLLKDASNLVSLKAEPPTIWRYQLLVYCDNKKGFTTSLYWRKLRRVQCSNEIELKDTFCIGPEDQPKPFDLTEVFQVAVQRSWSSCTGIDSVLYGKADAYASQSGAIHQCYKEL